MTDKKLLGLRKQINKKRPRFIQQDHQKRDELAKKWRKPKGLHSKMRHGFWGRPASVSVGYRGPKAVRGMHASGLVPVLIHTAAELEKIDPKTQGIVLAHVGGKKKIQILQACQQKNISVLNIKKVDEVIKVINDNLASRKEAKKAKTQKKATKTKAAEKKAEEKKPETEKTKEEERREAEKIITKKG